METFLLLPCADTAPSVLAGCEVTWGSRALYRPLLQFGGGDEQRGASSMLWGEVGWRHALPNRESAVGSARESAC